MALADKLNIDGTDYEIVPEIAPLFSTSESYAAGDSVIKDAKLYRFTSAHAAGAWTGNDATEIVVGDELTGIRADLSQQTNNAIDGEFVIPQDYLEQGAYSSQGVPIDNPVSLTRIRTKYKTYVKAGSTFVFTAGSVCALTYWFFFKDSGTLETSGAWVSTESKNFTEDGYLLFNFRASDSRNIIPSDYDADVVVKTSIANSLDEIPKIKANSNEEIQIITQKDLIYNTTQLESRRVVINSSNNWYATTGSNYGSSCVFPLPISAENVKVYARSDLSAVIAFLKSFDPSITSGTPDFCNGYTGKITISAGGSAEYTIPDDAKYFYYQASPSTGAEQTPTIVFSGGTININMLIPRGNIVPNYIAEYDNTYYSADSAGVSPSSGSSTSYGTLRIPVEPGTSYTCNKLRFLTLLGNDGKSVTASLQNITSFTTTTDTVRVLATYYKSENTKENLIISSGDYLDSETGMYEIPWLYDPNKKALTNLKNRTFGLVKPFLQYKGNDQSYMFESPNSIKRDKVCCFSCDFLTFGSIELGLAGIYGGNSVSVIVDETNITVKKKGTSGTGIPHGLTISNRISVVLTQTVDGKLQYEISSNGEKYTGETTYTNGYTSFYFEASNMTVSNVDFVSTCKDLCRDIWMFGDSYFSYGENRWVYYLITEGNSERCLIDAYAGEGSERSVPSLKSYIDLAKPKYILWCVGMNDGGDSQSAPKAAWMSAVNEVLGICNENDIVPVFGTIPSVPSINHEQKNAWIRNSGYQYIDFAKAVGAQSDGTWFSGMLSNDNTHPTALGAMALYYQAITDFPQLIQNK